MISPVYEVFLKLRPRGGGRGGGEEGQVDQQQQAPHQQHCVYGQVCSLLLSLLIKILCADPGKIRRNQKDWDPKPVTVHLYPLLLLSHRNSQWSSLCVFSSSPKHNCVSPGLSLFVFPHPYRNSCVFLPASVLSPSLPGYSFPPTELEPPDLEPPLSPKRHTTLRQKLARIAVIQ